MPRKSVFNVTYAGVLALGLTVGLAPLAHAYQGSCSQPKSSGAAPVATDCLFILRAAVGSATCDKPCICQPKGTGPTKASDALLCLFTSVGQPVATDCPCGLPDLEASDYAFDPAADIADPNLRSRFVRTNFLGAFSQDQDPSVGDWTQGWTVMLHGNNTVWHPASSGTLNGATPNADGVCPAGTTDIGNTNLPSPFVGTMDICQMADRYATQNATLTLTNDNVYRLADVGTGGTLIGDGDAAGKTPATASNQKLVIEPGTMILGDVQEALIVTRGAQVFVNGTKADPVEMNSITTWNDWVAGGTGLGARRQWGGFVVTGFANVNFCNAPVTCDATVEGVNAVVSYGGTDNAWNAGSIQYVVIRNSGFDLGGGNDLNGLTLYALGYPTVVSYVNVDNAGDDAIEFFGGSIVLDHAVTKGALDDNIDSDVGFTGGAQFVVVIQDADDGDKAIEADNGPGTSAFTTLFPRSLPNYINFTLINSTTASSSTPVGIGMRTFTGFNMWNSIQTSAERAGIRSENATVTNTGVGIGGSENTSAFHNLVLWNPTATKGNFEGSTNADTANVSTLFNSDPNNQSFDPMLGSYGYPNQVP